MITYVNTVLVSTKGAVLATKNDAEAAFATKQEVLNNEAIGKFVIMKMEGNFGQLPAANRYSADLVENEYVTKFRIGIITNKYTTIVDHKNGGVVYKPIIKWSNNIKSADITSFVATKYPTSGQTEDTVTLDFSNLTGSALETEFGKGNRRIVVRLTFKDMPTRYRKWTESYEYITAPNDTAITIAAAIVKQINTQYKRARVYAKVDQENNKKVILTAMPYDDDDANDSLNWANKVRFSVNAYYTDPTAPAFASKNKYSINGLVIKKVPGVWPTTSGKLVRDRESQAMGYQGILNRGEGTWPIIKPDMMTDITKNYDGITIMFENHYHAADDQIRRTKECVEIYDVAGSLNTSVERASSTNALESIKYFISKVAKVQA